MDRQVTHDKSDAAKDAQDAVKPSTNDYQKVRTLGLSLLNSGKFAEAEQEFRSALEERPKNAELFTLLSIALERLGRTDEAVSAAEEAVRLDDARHTRLGELYLSSGRVSEALAAFESAVATGHNSAHIQFLLSVAFERLGHSSEAFESARRAVELEPQDSRWAKRLAILAARTEAAVVDAEVEVTRRKLPDDDPAETIIENGLLEAHPDDDGRPWTPDAKAALAEPTNYDRVASPEMAKEEEKPSSQDVGAHRPAELPPTSSGLAARIRSLFSTGPARRR